MKKRLIILFTTITVIFLMPIIVKAAVTDDLTFDASTGTITDCAPNARGSLVIPEKIDGVSVANIGELAFANCVLTSITIPNSVTSIGDSAFSGCGNLSGITIPENVTKIGNDAFFNCYKVEEISVDINNKSYSSEQGVLFNKDQTMLIQYPIGKQATSYTVPNGVKTILTHAFIFSNLTYIMLPDSLNSIEYGAFAHCKNLTGITIPNSVTSIEDATFYECSGMTYVNLPDKLTVIGDHAFYKCENVSSINIPDSVTLIKDSAFYSCKKLSDIIIPDSVESIGDGVFDGTEYYANKNNWDAGVLYIGKHLVAANAEEIAPIYSIRNNTKTIAVGVFSNCGIEEITIPNGIKNIYTRTFYQSNLKNITIPNSVTQIGDYAFGVCGYLEKVIIPESVENISDSAFSLCADLKEFYVNKENNYYSSIDGNLFDKNGKKLIRYAVGKESPEYAVPTGVTEIGKASFSYSSNLQSIIIPSSVLTVDNSAFHMCKKLTDVYYAGTKDEWEKINIGEYNNTLLNAVIHYNSTTAYEPITPVEITVTKRGDGYCVSAQTDYDGTAYAAVYDSRGCLLRVDSTPFAGGSAELAPYIPDNAASIKFFVWTNTYQPVTLAKEVNI